MWRTLYTPGSELQKGYIKVWEQIASFFSQPEYNSPFIMGYELLNEPSAGCINGCGMENYGGAFWGIDGAYGTPSIQEMLLKLYQKATKVIRTYDPTRLIIFEVGMDFGSYSGDPGLWANMTAKPVGIEDPNAMVGYHSYHCQVQGLRGEACDKTQREVVNYQKNWAAQVMAGSLLSEFGAIGFEHKGEVANLGDMVKVCQDHLQSWVYWSYKLMHDFTTMDMQESLVNPINGSINTGPRLEALTRPYAPAVQGIHCAMDWDPSSGQLQLCYEYDPSILTPTEVYLGTGPIESVHVETIPNNAVFTMHRGNWLQMWTQLKMKQQVRVIVYINQPKTS